MGQLPVSIGRFTLLASQPRPALGRGFFLERDNCPTCGIRPSLRAVTQVMVNDSTSSGLARCIRGVLMGLTFPSFNGPRTKANFTMSI